MAHNHLKAEETLPVDRVFFPNGFRNSSTSDYRKSGSATPSSYRVVSDYISDSEVSDNIPSGMSYGSKTDVSLIKSGKSRKRPTQLTIATCDSDVSSSVVDVRSRSVNIQFTDLSYSVKVGILKRESRVILHGVSGEFHSGELTAIMGPSGAGKSTLMDVLAGYTRDGVTGSVKTNGVERDIRQFRRSSCYIMQDDKLQPLLSVQEAMMIAASLKTGSRLSHSERQDRVEEILQALGLLESRKTMTGCLSGGQRKRLAIAQELVNNPPVMFFDEPTSGLDSSTTKQCVSVLKLLAKEGRTIVCTIHQPSALLFEMFDHLYSLTEGRCVYQGSVQRVIPYLDLLGLKCPAYHNPADFLLEVSTGEYGDKTVDSLVAAINNGKSNNWRRKPTEPTFLPVHITQAMESGQMTPVRAPQIPPTPHPGLEKNEKAFDKVNTSERLYQANFWSQFTILLRRTFLLLTRDKSLTQTRMLMHVLIGILIGTLYFRIGNEASHVFDNFSLLYFCVMFLMFTSFSSMILTFPYEIPIIAREYFNRWYSLKSYYLAVTLADTPIQVLCTIGYSLVVYFMTAQPPELGRFVLFVIMCVLVSLVAQSIGLLVGVSMSVQNGMVFGPLAIMPFTIFSGFFVHMKDAPSYFQWLFHVSYLKYGLEGVMIAVYGYKRARLECNADYCHFMSPLRFLQELDMADADYLFNVVFLFMLNLGLRFVSYLVLLYQLNHKR